MPMVQFGWLCPSVESVEKVPSLNERTKVPLSVLLILELHESALSQRNSSRNTPFRKDTSTVFPLRSGLCCNLYSLMSLTQRHHGVTGKPDTMMSKRRETTI